MREIKFRGKSMGGHWEYGLLTKKKIRNSGKLSYAIAQGNYTLADTIPVDEKTIGEYTGCRDKNGVEIYEGDILIDEYDSAILEVYNEAGGWCLKLKGKCEGWLVMLELNHFRVIGNIFDGVK